MDNIWAKPNPMPSSVEDRCTTSHEYLFQLTKSANYFYDHVAIQEPATSAGQGRGGSNKRYEQNNAGMDNKEYATRNKRSVWHVQPASFKGSHFAVFPPELIRPCILASTSEEGCCSACGAPWERMIERSPMEIRTSEKGQSKHDQGLRTSTSGTMTKPPELKTLGWKASCECNAEKIPCTVLDPFLGSGTTLQVCREVGVRGVGIELNEDYCKVARDKRLRQQTIT